MLEYPTKLLLCVQFLVRSRDLIIMISLLHLSIDRPIFLALLSPVIWIKSRKRWLRGKLHQLENWFSAVPRVVNVYEGYKGDGDDVANTTSSSTSINMDDIETKGTDTDSSVVGACDADVSLP